MIRIPVRRLAAFGLTAGLTLGIAAPAWAAAETPPAALDQLKAKADEKIKERLTHLGTLDSAVGAAAADCGHNAALRSQLAADKAGLTALDATIQAETDRAKAVAEYRQIFTDYRVYWLETPKTHEVLGCDRLTRAGAALSSVQAKIQARTDQAKANGKDTSAAQAALDDMGAKLAAATAAANQADDSAIALHADKGDRTVLASNNAAIQAGRQQLRTAFTDLQAARADARKAIDALKSA
jgi:hypothetical protein